MTKPRDPDALLAAYLADGMEVLPDRVVDAVLDEVHRTHQRVVFGPWRTRSMFKTALGAAAVFAVLLLGGTFLLFQRGQPALVGGPSQTPAIASPALGANASPSVDPSPTVVPPRAASWTPTGDMVGRRLGGTAVLLQDGKVLVFGGNPGSPNAELYDPASETWTATAPMPNAGGTATLLLDGKVLVVGDGATAELYDPMTGSWTATGKLHTNHYEATATLLPDGRVLVAGGVSRGDGVFDPVASAELYDPRTGSWTRTGSMATKRTGATATLLRDGMVLVAGGAAPTGNYAGEDVASAELYDPGTGIWTKTGRMTQPRSYHEATLLQNGKVLVTTGYGTTSQLYDPGTGSWTATASPSTLTGGFSVTVLRDGRVLAAGGAPGPQDVGNQSLKCGPSSAAAELYDPRTGTWTATSDMIQGRHGHTATLLPDGSVLVASGATGSWNPSCRPGIDGPTPSELSSAELYDPGTGQ